MGYNTLTEISRIAVEGYFGHYFSATRDYHFASSSETGEEHSIDSRNWISIFPYGIDWGWQDEVIFEISTGNAETLRDDSEFHSVMNKLARITDYEKLVNMGTIEIIDEPNEPIKFKRKYFFEKES